MTPTEVVRLYRHTPRDDASNPTLFLAEPRVGYRMPKGEG